MHREALHALDGNPPRDHDLAPGLLEASYCLDARDFLGILECIALVSYQVGQEVGCEVLHPKERNWLRGLELFQRRELRRMHQALASSELALAAYRMDMSGALACCRASEYGQRMQAVEMLESIQPGLQWSLRAEWEEIQRSRDTIFQAASVFVAWLHQRFDLHYRARELGPCIDHGPADNASLRPYLLRTICLPPQPIERRARLAGWRCDDTGKPGVLASLLVVPALRDSAPMVKALRDAASTQTGPFCHEPAARKGVVVTELLFVAGDG